MTEIIKKPRGLAAMSPEKRRAVQSMGGNASPMSFKNNPELAKAAGIKSRRKTNGKA